MNSRELQINRAIGLVRADSEAALDGRTDRLSGLRGQHIFITGGTGFLGCWLLELFGVLNEKYGFDITLTVLSRRPALFEGTWPHLYSAGYLHFQTGDIRHVGGLPPDVRYIIHAAALTDRRLFASQPSEVAEINALGTVRIMRSACLLENLEKIVLLSSGLTYGSQPLDMPAISEDFEGSLKCSDVTSVYAESKRFSETVGRSAISEWKLPVAILRPFAFVGPYQSLSLPWAVTDCIRDSFNGGPIRILGDGSTVRSLMYGSDFAYSVIAALAAAPARRTYNIGSPKPVDLKSLAEKVVSHFSPMPEIMFRTGQTGHHGSRLVPDIHNAERDFGASVTVPLDAAISKTIEWNRHIRDGTKS